MKSLKESFGGMFVCAFVATILTLFFPNVLNNFYFVGFLVSIIASLLVYLLAAELPLIAIGFAANAAIFITLKVFELENPNFVWIIMTMYLFVIIIVSAIESFFEEAKKRI